MNGHRSPEDIDRLLSSLPAHPGANPPDHVDDGDLLAYRAAGLDDARTQEIDRHLAECRDCRELLAAMAEPAPQLPIPINRRRSIAVALPLAGAAIAIAASAVLFFTPSTPDSAPQYVIRTARGAAELRGAEPAGNVAHVAPIAVLPDTRFLAVLEPKLDLEGTAPAIAAFIQRERDPLRRVPSGAVEIGEGGAVKIEAKARELFGETAGAFTVWTAIAPAGTALDRIDGLTIEQARETTRGAQWIPIEVESRREE